MANHHYVVIMAGGIGSRFWPFSTKDYPKQFHDMLGCGRSLLQKTYDRFNAIIPTQNIFVLTNRSYAALVQEQLSEINPNQILLEPQMRNTAPCILYASLKIQQLNKQAICVVAPSDHWIEDEDTFRAQIALSFEFCEKNPALLTLGVLPTFPNTGYGYIEFEKQEGADFKQVIQFKEKPDYEVAKEYIAKGNFLWNAGIFIWSVETILNEFKQHQDQMFKIFDEGRALWNTGQEQAFIDENFPKAANISIDYAILEQASKVYVLPTKFDWNDLGTWGSLYDKLEKDEQQNNLQDISVTLDNCHGNIIKTQNIKRIIAKDLKDYIIVEFNHNLLLIPQKDEQLLKELLERE